MYEDLNYKTNLSDSALLAAEKDNLQYGIEIYVGTDTEVSGPDFVISPDDTDGLKLFRKFCLDMHDHFKKLMVVMLFALFFSSCVATRPDYAEQAELTGYTREAKNKAVCVLRTVTGKTIIYYDKHRGMGKSFWKVFDKYTVHFSGNVVIKITRNQ